MNLEHVLPITNKYGLHARASTRLAQVAQRYEARILISKESGSANGDSVRSEEVDAKSVLGILSLGAECGDRVWLRVSGEDAEQALRELTELVELKFHED